MIKTIIAALVLATSLPVSKVDSSQTGADSIDVAAENGIQAAFTASTMLEYAGGVYLYKGKFYYTLPVTQDSDKSVDYSIQLPKDGKLLAVYHTHPSGPGRTPDEFSKGDLVTAKRMKLIMYVGVIHNQQVMKFNPAIDHPLYSEFSQGTGYYGSNLAR